MKTFFFGGVGRENALSKLQYMLFNFLLAASSYSVSEEVNEIGLLLIKKKEKRNKVLYQFSVYAHP
jgi:hypothetical protein